MKITTSTKVSSEQIPSEKIWYLINAENQTLGRLATKIATILRGKHRSDYSPNKDMGDFVIIINAKKIKTTGNKLQDKIYYRHTGYIGNMKSINLADLLEKKPNLVIEKAIKGMLPKNPLGRKMFKKLKIYPTDIHPHQAQNPIEINP